MAGVVGQFNQSAAARHGDEDGSRPLSESMLDHVDRVSDRLNRPTQVDATDDRQAALQWPRQQS